MKCAKIIGLPRGSYNAPTSALVDEGREEKRGRKRERRGWGRNWGRFGLLDLVDRRTPRY